MYKYKSKKFIIMSEKMRLPNGKWMEIEFHVGKSGVCVLPIDKEGRIILVYQYRPYVKEWVYEIPGGKIDNGESPKTAALRELNEETGYKAGKIKFMMKYYTAPYFSTEAPYMFIASDLKKSKTNREDDELMSLKHIRLDKALGMIEKGKIKDLGTIAAILMYSRISKHYL